MPELTQAEFDRMIRFCPHPHDSDGETYMRLTAFGWADCSDEQNEWLNEHRDEHISAAPYVDRRVRRGALSFKMFVVRGIEYEGGNPRKKLYPDP